MSIVPEQKKNHLRTAFFLPFQFPITQILQVLQKQKLGDMQWHYWRNGKIPII
jgi:hypothetical protein